MSILSKIFGRSSEPPLPNPFEVGIILAGSLIEGGDPNALLPAEADSLAAAGLSHGSYSQERFVFRASAASTSMAGLLRSDAVRHEVGRGFLQWFADNAARSQENALVAALYKKRMPAYLAAAQQDRANPAQRGALHFSQISGRFAENLLDRSDGGASAEAACQILALAVADAYWFAQQAGSESLFRRARLIH